MMSVLVLGHILSRELPCGNPCYFKLRGNKVKRGSFFWAFIKSQIQLDLLLSDISSVLALFIYLAGSHFVDLASISKF